MDRRRFLTTGSAAGLALAGASWGHPAEDASPKPAPNDRIGVACVGLRGRGGALLNTFAALPEVEVRYVCDVDQRVLEASAERIEKQIGRKPQAVGDFRRAIDDKAVDALVLGTPDHWHAIPTVLACQAGKDVYVEKPDGHNVLESRTMAAAARKHQRVVQLGTQARSGPHVLSAMAYVAKGALGRVRYAKGWESAKQGSIGHPPDGDPPPGVDYDTWLGPAPKRPFNARRFHGSWRWFFDYGTGDLGNDGVHRLDIARWGLETALGAKGEKLAPLPAAVSAHGGKHYFDDDQEWPDNLMVTYDYGNCLLTYEMRIWTPYRLHEESEGAAVLGDEGFIVIGNGRWRAYDSKGNEVAQDSGGYNDAGHARNFLECMRTRKPPAADLPTIGHPSSMLCHLGNAAWRAGRTIRYDAGTGTVPGDDEANKFLRRTYREPWVLPSVDG